MVFWASLIDLGHLPNVEVAITDYKIQELL
jgi:hypothetical protein